MNDPAASAVLNAELPVPAKVRIERRGALVNVILDRPKALNAFDDDMRAALSAEIPRISRNADVYIVVLSSSGPRAFCAGGDVRALVATAKNDLAKAKAMFAAEYYLDWLLECFSKPSVSLINGLCMGSGAGLSSYNTHRVAGENYAFAMPETAIGLFPDVGVSYVLARLPWPIGLYLGLTGRSAGRADAHWLGLATHCIGSDKFEHILTQLSDAQPVDPLLDGLHEVLEPGPIQRERKLIEQFFSAQSLKDILARLEGARGEDAEWAGAVLSELRKKSPLSLAITDRHIRSCRNLDLRQVLLQDYRLACRFLESPEFAEGVRAALIDKDNAPRWIHARAEDVKEAEIARFFEPLSNEAEFVLPLREQMQAARV